MFFLEKNTLNLDLKFNTLRKENINLFYYKSKKNTV